MTLNIKVETLHLFNPKVTFFGARMDYKGWRMITECSQLHKYCIIQCP